MFTIEHLDGERLSADGQGWKVVDMPLSSIEQSVISEQPAMRPGRLVYGVSHGLRTCQLVFTVLFSTNLVYEQLVDLVNYHVMRGEPFYLYRDFRTKAERMTSLPKKRLLVIGKSVVVERLGRHKARFEVTCESYGLPYQEDTDPQTRTWNGTTHQLTNSGGHQLDPRYCQMMATVRVEADSDHAKILFNGQPYFWYKKPVKAGDVFIIDGVSVSKNGVNCFEDCHKRTAALKVGLNRIQIQGTSLAVDFSYRQLYL